MAASNWFMYGHALEKVMDGTIDLDTDSFRIALVTASYTPAQFTDDAWSDISANEVSGTGYTANGAALSMSLSRSSGAVTVDNADVTWSSSSITAKYPVIVHDANGNGTLDTTDIPVFYCDANDGGGSVTSTAGNWTITMNASGIYTITATTDS